MKRTGASTLFLITLVLILIYVWRPYAQAQNGFDLSEAAVPAEEILKGGPPRDGIPALTDPKMVPAKEATFLKDTDRVIGIADGKKARAYPIKVLTFHEVVNDKLGKTPVAVTYCPLNGGAIVYDARNQKGKRREFGVSGLLYKSTLLFYDRQTDSLWSQIPGSAVTGENKGTTLEAIPAVDTTWKSWKEKHPDTLVLSADTGHVRNYERNPYEEYEKSPDPMFSVGREDGRLAAKERVVGVNAGNQQKAYPISRLLKAVSPVRDRLASSEITLVIDRENEAIRAKVNGTPKAVYKGYWFTWQAFYPDTAIWSDAASETKEKK